jgi:Cu+-exporting ATPase
MHAAERGRMLRHLIVCIVVAIPTIISGIAFMNLVPADDHVRQYIMQPMQSGNASRLSWALHILVIPAHVYATKSFHLRAFKQLRTMW